MKSRNLLLWFFIAGYLVQDRVCQIQLQATLVYIDLILYTTTIQISSLGCTEKLSLSLAQTPQCYTALVGPLTQFKISTGREFWCITELTWLRKQEEINNPSLISDFFGLNIKLSSADRRSNSQNARCCNAAWWFYTHFVWRRPKPPENVAL